jgi:hypothetical protein
MLVRGGIVSMETVGSGSQDVEPHFLVKRGLSQIIIKIIILNNYMSHRLVFDAWLEGGSGEIIAWSNQTICESETKKNDFHLFIQNIITYFYYHVEPNT